MLKFNQLINRLFKKQIVASNAVEYLVTHMQYHINLAGNLSIFGKNQLRFLINEKFPELDEAMQNKVINISLQNIANKPNISKIITNEAIYLGVS